MITREQLWNRSVVKRVRNMYEILEDDIKDSKKEYENAISDLENYKICVVVQEDSLDMFPEKKKSIMYRLIPIEEENGVEK